MSNNYEFLLSKINELELKVFELESKVQILENAKKNEGTMLSSVNTHNTKVERYSFEGKVYKKSKLVLAVINKYVNDNPNISAEELEKAFPSYEFKLSTFGCVKKVDEIPSKHLTPVKRYFADEDLLITLKDGTKMAVCTQWGTNIGLFIEYVKKYGYEIELKIN